MKDRKFIMRISDEDYALLDKKRGAVTRSEFIRMLLRNYSIEMVRSDMTGMGLDVNEGTKELYDSLMELGEEEFPEEIVTKALKKRR